MDGLRKIVFFNNPYQPYDSNYPEKGGIPVLIKIKADWSKYKVYKYPKLSAMKHGIMIHENNI